MTTHVKLKFYLKNTMELSTIYSDLKRYEKDLKQLAKSEGFCYFNKELIVDSREIVAYRVTELTSRVKND